MTDLTANDFATFFQALWNKPPFAWQRRLTERVMTEGWPEAIALATGSGKTACLDIAVFALAAQAPRLARGDVIDAPRRVFFVVDRRVIVDAAHQRAQRIANALQHAQDGILKTIADQLRLIAGDADTASLPLSVHALRGGMYRSEAWAKSPVQPTIVCSTVDQVGSRLLFRAYGRGPGMWPVYAGLVANDALILLDEAHCALPFMQTLQAVAQYKSWATQPLNRGFRPVVMSATPPPGLHGFHDESDEPRTPDHPLGRRQLARKPATLHIESKATGAKATQALAKAMVQAALALTDDTRRAVVVFVNRVATARAVRDLLKARDDVDHLLLTGRMRAIDKDRLIRGPLAALNSDNAEHRTLTRPMIVVATQTLEVGADLDFDALVSECAALDALRQRFGRLNRTGRGIDARARILIRADQVSPKQPDPVYGNALAATWRWLNEHLDDNAEIDFGITAFADLAPGDDPALTTPSPDAPVMLPAHLDFLAQTAPAPVPSPEVALFLHGPRSAAADVQVCLRTDIDANPRGAARAIPESLALCPPSSAESFPVPISTLRAWMAHQLAVDDSSDIEGRHSDNHQDDTPTGALRAVLRWRGIEDAQWIDRPEEIRPGDILVVSASRSDATALGDIPDDSPLDVADSAHRSARAKAILRLHPSLVAAWPDGPGRVLAEALLNALHQDPDTYSETVATRCAALLGALDRDAPNADTPTSWLTLAAHDLLHEFRTPTQLSRAIKPITGGIALVGNRLIPELVQLADGFSDEDDLNASGINRPNGQPVTLKTHLPGVAKFARQFAAGCGLAPTLVATLECAGLLHDLGKADPRFQALLRGGTPWLTGEPLAKSGALAKSARGFRQARAASGYPRGGRHELLSVRLAESAPALLPTDPALRDLALHLVASHHGHCRPFAPIVDDPEAIEVQYEWAGQHMTWRGPTHLEHIGAETAERYWRLIRRYGWWGLAWLEALLRLADHRRSEWEESHDDAA